MNDRAVNLTDEKLGQLVANLVELEPERPERMAMLGVKIRNLFAKDTPVFVERDKLRQAALALNHLACSLQSDASRLAEASEALVHQRDDELRRANVVDTCDTPLVCPKCQRSVNTSVIPHHINSAGRYYRCQCGDAVVDPRSASLLAALEPAASATLDRLKRLEDAVRPLANLAVCYSQNGLDEARPERELGIEHDREVVLVEGRGGRELLTVGDSLAALAALRGD
jgi:hypothetical protein